MSTINVGRDALAHIGAGVSGGSAATALSVANEIVQLIAGLVAIAAGVASLLHFLKKRKSK
jgi:hypothetical protein